MLWACRPPRRPRAPPDGPFRPASLAGRSVGDGGWVLEPRACGPGLVVAVCCIKEYEKKKNWYQVV